MSGRSHDTSTQVVFSAGQTALGRSPCQGRAATRVHRRFSLPARLHSAGRRVREEPPHTYTGGLLCRPDRTWQVAALGKSRDSSPQAVFLAGQTALGRSPCQGRAATHEHRQSSLPARPHSAGRRVREEPRHTYTGGLLCRPDRTRQVAVSGKSRDTRTQAVFSAGQTALGRSPCQGRAATHVHRLSSLPARPHSAGRRVREEPRHTYTGCLLCRPDRTWQVAVSGKNRNTRTQAVFSAGQTALGRSPCQGRAATHVHRLSSLPARPHLAGRRVREEPQHTYTGCLLCRPDRTRQVAVSGKSRDTRTQAVFSAGQTALGRSPCQGRTATHVHRLSSLPARPHSAGRRVREEP